MTFGGFALDRKRRVLTFRGDPVRITSKEFELLAVLASADGRVVTKDEIVYHAWRDAAVSDASLAQTVYRLRKTLATLDPHRDYICTIPGRGYQFTVAVENDEPGRHTAVAGPTAFAVYRRAMHHLDARTAQSLHRAVDLFSEALREEPDYTPALVGLAQSHAYLGEYSFAHPSEAFVAAKRAALAALRIEPGNAEAYAVLGDVLMFYERDWNAAGLAYATARRFAPYSTTTMLLSAWHAVAGGDADAAVAHLTAALTLAPTSPLLNTALAALTFFGRRDASASLAILNDVLTFAPGFALALLHAGLIHACEGNWDEAERCLTGVAEEAFAPQAQSVLCYTYAKRGDTERAAYVLRSLEEAAGTRSWEFHRAIALLGFERYDECLEALRAACDASEPEVVLLMANPLLSRLADDRRFPDVLAHARTKPKEHCERCGRPFESAERRFSCSYNCTYCAECTDALSSTCKNCGGPLTPLKRP